MLEEPVMAVRVIWQVPLKEVTCDSQIFYYLLFIIYYLLFIIYYLLLFIIYYLLFIIYYLLFIIYYLLLLYILADVVNNT